MANCVDFPGVHPIAKRVDSTANGRSVLRWQCNLLKEDAILFVPNQEKALLEATEAGQMFIVEAL
jgi:hypothetical protein